MLFTCLRYMTILIGTCYKQVPNKFIFQMNEINDTIVEFISLETNQSVYSIKLGIDTLISELFDILGQIIEKNPNSFVLNIGNKSMTNSDSLMSEDRICDFTIRHQKLIVKYSLIKKNFETFDDLSEDQKAQFLDKCLGRQPFDTEIELIHKNKQIKKGLNLIYQGNKECRRNGFVFLDFNPSNEKCDRPLFNLYIAESRSLIDMGIKRETFQPYLQECKGNIDRILDKIKNEKR